MKRTLTAALALTLALSAELLAQPRYTTYHNLRIEEDAGGRGGNLVVEEDAQIEDLLSAGAVTGNVVAIAVSSSSPASSENNDVVVPFAGTFIGASFALTAGRASCEVRNGTTNRIIAPRNVTTTAALVTSELSNTSISQGGTIRVRWGPVSSPDAATVILYVEQTGRATNQ